MQVTTMWLGQDLTLLHELFFFSRKRYLAQPRQVAGQVGWAGLAGLGLVLPQ